MSISKLESQSMAIQMHRKVQSAGSPSMVNLNPPAVSFKLSSIQQESDEKEGRLLSFGQPKKRTSEKRLLFDRAEAKCETHERLDSTKPFSSCQLSSEAPSSCQDKSLSHLLRYYLQLQRT